MAPRKIAEERICRISSSGTVWDVRSVVSTIRLVPSHHALQPRASKIRMEASTSFSRGQRCSSTCPRAKMVAARMGSTAFFAPWTRISPVRALPPRI